jgi:hypothetical protein
MQWFAKNIKGRFWWHILWGDILLHVYTKKLCCSVPYTIFSISVCYKKKTSADLMCYIMCMTHWKGVWHLCLLQIHSDINWRLCDHITLHCVTNMKMWSFFNMGKLVCTSCYICSRFL